MRAGARLPLRLVPTDCHAPASAGAGRGRHVAAEGRSGQLWGRQGTSGGCDFSHRGVVSYVGRVNEKMHVVITNCRKLSKELQQASAVSSGEGGRSGKAFPDQWCLRFSGGREERDLRRARERVSGRGSRACKGSAAEGGEGLGETERGH